MVLTFIWIQKEPIQKGVDLHSQSASSFINRLITQRTWKTLYIFHLKYAIALAYKIKWFAANERNCLTNLLSMKYKSDSVAEFRKSIAKIGIHRNISISSYVGWKRMFFRFNHSPPTFVISEVWYFRKTLNVTRFSQVVNFKN